MVCSESILCVLSQQSVGVCILVTLDFIHIACNGASLDASPMCGSSSVLTSDRDSGVDAAAQEYKQTATNIKAVASQS